MYTHDNKGLSLPHGQPWSRLLQPFIDSHRGCEWGMLCLYWAITLHRATLQTSCQVPPSIPTHENASWKCVKDLQISQNLQHIPRNTLLPPWSYTFFHWLHTFGSYFYHRICPMPNTITTFQRVQKHSKKAQNIPNTSKIILKNTNFQNMPEQSSNHTAGSTTNDFECLFVFSNRGAILEIYPTVSLWRIPLSKRSKFST